MDVRVIVFYGEQYDSDWPPEDATEFIAWFAQKVDAIPPEFRASAKIELESVERYEQSHYARIYIHYLRPEMSHEKLQREATDRKAQEDRKLRDLKTLADLKAKYERAQ